MANKDQMVTQIEELTYELESTKEERDELMSYNEELSDRVAMLESDAVEYQEAIADMNEEIDRLTDELATLASLYSAATLRAV